MTDRDSRDRKVLVVEDDEDARFLMRLELERLGYLVLEAADGEQAVEIAVGVRYQTQLGSEVAIPPSATLWSRPTRQLPAAHQSN